MRSDFAGDVATYYARYRRGYPPAVADPWDGRTLEWGTSSPPPVHNFDEIPTVSHLDEWWHRKYQEDESGRVVFSIASSDRVKNDQITTFSPRPPTQSSISRSSAISFAGTSSYPGTIPAGLEQI